MPSNRRAAGSDETSESQDVESESINGEQRPQRYRKIRIHKIRPQSATPDAAASSDKGLNAAMDRRIAELIPGLAGLKVNASGESSLKVAGEVRAKQMAKQNASMAEVLELKTIYDMSKPHPLDNEVHQGPWDQQLRPRVRKVQLSAYQYEMINYQRMLMRKNVWYYRDRMNVPRGPCPLHVLKDAWVQGVVDENTLMWGQGLYDWIPAKNIKLLLPMIRTPEVMLGAWMKRTFSLKPALNKIRESRKEQREPGNLSKQVDSMR